MAKLSHCGCWYAASYQKTYLPQVKLTSYTTILATTSRTVLTQKFINKGSKLKEVQYTFPLYDSVTVVGFKCSVGDRVIIGKVKEKQQARAQYQQAVEHGETAGLLEQLPEASDVFTTHVGNVPADRFITVEVVYLGELKQDAETDGTRFTIPTAIAPRYGNIHKEAKFPRNPFSPADASGGIQILVDVQVEDGSVIRGLQSPSHPIAVEIGRLSSNKEDVDTFTNNHASASLTLNTTELDKDFVIVVLAKEQDTPRALLEHHANGYRALMTTLVPKFKIPQILPELVFVIDRSGSMGGKENLVISALKVFLKSLPVGVKFNLCSFGSHHDYLFEKSKIYDQSNLQAALNYVEGITANYGGTQMLEPIKDTVKQRLKGMPLEVMVITDGQIWEQEKLFSFIGEATTESVRFFSLGIGSGASSSLVEGIARAGDGFAQFVGDNEKMDKRVVRMLKGALTPHIKDYTLEVLYENEEDEFEIVESVTDSLKNLLTTDTSGEKKETEPTRISLFDVNTKEEPTNPSAGKYDHLPIIAAPKLLQAPHKIPPLYRFNRTSVYLLMSPESCQCTPKTVILRASSEHGPLKLEIPVQDIGMGETIHQLAAKKSVQELEEGRGWIIKATDKHGNQVDKAHEARVDEIVEREAVRLGVMFQVGGKWTSFVAVEENSKTGQTDEHVMEGKPLGVFEREEGVQNYKTGSKSGVAATKRRSMGSRCKKSIQPDVHFDGSETSPQKNPDSQNVLKRNEVRELATLNGTLRDDGQRKKTKTPMREEVFQFSTTRTIANRSHSTEKKGGAVPHRSTFGRVMCCTAVSLAGTGTSGSGNSAGLFGASSNSSAPLRSVSRPQASQYMAQQYQVPAPAQSNTLFSGMAKRSSPASSKSGSLFGGGGSLFGSSSNPSGGASANSSNQSTGLSGNNNNNTQSSSLFGGAQYSMEQSPPQHAQQMSAAYYSPLSSHLGATNDQPQQPAFGQSVSPPAARTATEAKALTTTSDRMHALIALQAFDGHWEWNSDFVTGLGIDKAKLTKIANEVLRSYNEEVKGTIVAIAFLRAMCAGEKEVWEMVAGKGMSWLEGRGMGDWGGGVKEVGREMGGQMGMEVDEDDW